MDSFAQTLLFKPSGSVLLLRNLLVIFICVFFLTNGLNSWLEYHLAPDYTGLISRQQQSGPEKKAKNLEQAAGDSQVIIERNIFGGSPYEPSEEEKKEVALEQIPLADDFENLILLGTIIKSDESNIAIIENKKKREQKMYVTGDQIQGATIKKILRNNVVIHDGTEDKMLSIDYQVRKSMQSKTGQPENSVSSEAQQVSFSVDRDYVQTAMSSMNSLLQSARIRPFIQKGKPQGFQLSRIKDGSLFDRLHLQDGDILLGTEDFELTNPQMILNLAEEMKNRDSVQLRIKRKGQNMNIEYNLQ